jgi:hypothetical protein
MALQVARSEAPDRAVSIDICVTSDGQSMVASGRIEGDRGLILSQRYGGFR